MANSIRNKKCSAGFTLVEILIMLAVVAMLAGLIASGGNAARKRAKIFRTQTMISSLETALAMYHVDFGDYPPSGNQSLVNLLTDEAAYSSNADWQGPYISFKNEDLSGSASNATLQDPWDNDYSYTNDGGSYAIKSAGEDGVFSTSDDITSD